MRYDVWFIAIALLCLLAGISLGFWFMTPFGGDLAQLPSHAHFNLLGWVTLALYGLIHHAFPALANSRFATPQFWLAVVGGICLPVGFATPHEIPLHNILVGVGAFGGALAALSFAIMFSFNILFAGRR